MSITAEQQQDIENIRSEKYQTIRATVPALEEKLYTAVPVLDHGFVRVVDYMGDDHAIVQAARVSYGSGTKSVRNDAGLIRYLLRHRHTTPFEMCEMKFHMKMPVFVARQWIRHRTANVNEYSARYSVLDNEFYIPKAEDIATQSKINNQGRGEQLSEADAAKVIELLNRDSKQCYETYESLMEEQNVARELARMNLPVNIYTQWYWKIDLHNLLHFLSLRADPHAQYEIRVYAEAMLDLVRAWVPVTMKAFEDYRQGAFTFSADMLAVLRRKLAGEDVCHEDTDLSKREWDEMMKALSQ